MRILHLYLHTKICIYCRSKIDPPALIHTLRNLELEKNQVSEYKEIAKLTIV